MNSTTDDNDDHCYRVFCKLLQTWLRLNHHFVSVVSSHFASVAIGLVSFCDLDSSAALPGSERPSTKIGMVRIKVPPGVCGGGGRNYSDFLGNSTYSIRLSERFRSRSQRTLLNNY
ncbi:hypothetical protein GQX74_003889 [Glossina fuscipes]|nr:hypothetical protein GQX74_003889 [Glossina fuscipes]